MRLRDEDRRGPCRRRDEHRELADRARAGDQDAVSELDPRALRGVHHRRERLEDRALVVADRVRQRNRLVARHDGLLGEAAPRPRHPRDAQVAAERLATAHAEVALAAEHVRQHRAAIADPDGGDVRADLEDVGRELVAEDLRQVLVRDEPPPTLVLVQVGPADAAEPRPHADLVGPDVGRSSDLLDAQVVHAMEAGGVHQIAVIPPSAAQTAPVTYEASSDARNSITAATSSAVPGRPMGIVASSASCSAGVTHDVIGVSL